MYQSTPTVESAVAPRRASWKAIVAVVSLVTVGALVLFFLHRSQAPRIASFLRQKTDEFNALGQTREAIRYLQLYSSMYPNDVKAFGRLALMYAQLDDPGASGEAQRRLQQAIRRDSTRIDLTEALIGVCLRRGDNVVALNNAKLLASGNPAPASPLGNKVIGDAYLANKQPEEALKYFDLAVQQAPRNLPAQQSYLDLLWTLRRNQKEFDTAVDQMLANNPGAPGAMLVAHVVRRTHNLPGADAILDDALRIAPNDVDVLLMAAGNHLGGASGQAGEYLGRAFEAKRDDRRVLLIYGKWLAARGNASRAMELFQRGFELSNQTDPEFAWRSAELLVENGRFDKLGPYMDVLLQEPNRRPAYHFLLGRQEDLRGQFGSAQKRLLVGKGQLEKNTGNYPDGGELLFKTHLALVGVYFHLGETENALNEAKLAANLAPHSHLPWFTIGGIEFENRNYAESVAAWQKVISMPGVPAKAYFELARALFYVERDKPPAKRNLVPFQKAIETALAKLPDDPDLAILQADANWTLGARSAAIDELIAGFQAHGRPDEPSAFPIGISAVRLMLADEQLDRAERMMEPKIRLLARNPDERIALELSAARLDYRRNQTGKAEARLKAQLDRATVSQKSVLLRTLGELAWLRGDVEEANGHFLSASLTGADLDGPTWRLDFLIQQGRVREGYRFAADLFRAEERPIGWRWTDAQLAMASFECSPKLALADLQRHVLHLSKIAPRWWGTLELRGRVAELEGTTDEAISLYWSSLVGGPAGNVVLDRLTELFAAQNRSQDIDGMLTLVAPWRFPNPLDASRLARATMNAESSKRAIQLADTFPKDFALQRRRALLLVQTNQLDAAEKAYPKLAADFPNNSGAWLDWARFLWKQREMPPSKITEQLQKSMPVDQLHSLSAEIAVAMDQRTEALREFDQSGGKDLNESSWRLYLALVRSANRSDFFTLANRAKQSLPDSPWLDELLRNR